MKAGSFTGCLLGTLIAVASSSSASAVEDWAGQMVQTKKVDFGVIATGSEARKYVEVKNIYNQPVHISNVRTTCGCSAATPGKTTLQPGESSMVSVEMNTRKFRQRKDSNLIIQFDAPQFAETRIPITAYIRSDVVFEPGMVRFGNVDYGKSVESKVKIAYAGRNDWEIVDVRIGNKSLSADLVPTRREGGFVDYTLNVKLADNAKTGQLRDLVTLVTNDQNHPYVPLMVEGVIVPDITVTPATVDVRNVAPGESRSFRIVVKGKKPFKIEDVDCEGMDDCFSAQISEKTQPIHVVPVEFNVPNKPGKFREELIVKIAGRSEPLRFQVSGLIN